MEGGTRDGVAFIQGGRDSGGRAILLLHGLGATKEVWLPFIEQLEASWAGHWIAPDFPGHGASIPCAHDSFGAYASSVSSILPADTPIIVLGHSLGGAVGLLLGSGLFGTDVRSVHALSVKIAWRDAEVGKAIEFSRSSPRFFETEADAIVRHLKVSGLFGLVPETHPAARAGVIATDRGWRLAASPATNGVARGDVNAILKICRSPAHFATGELDPIAVASTYEGLGLEARTLPSLGHNAHVQDPCAVCTWLHAGLTAPRDGA